MAKVKGPLMSLGASGQLGKSLVFMTWKGIADVRQHVVPANPKSAGQLVQRGFLTAAVAAWHAFTRNVLDVAAFNVAASIRPVPMSGFNNFCRYWIVLLKTPLVPHSVSSFTVTANTGGSFSFTWVALTGLTMLYKHGTSPVVLTTVTSAPESGTPGVYGATLAGLTVGVDYYIRPVTSLPNTAVAGIYKIRALA
jgi:hypothetical protein